MDNLSPKELEKIKIILDNHDKDQKEIKFNKKIVMLVLFLNVSFTLLVLYLYSIGWNEPSTLINNWFKFTGVELVSLAGIKGLDIVREIFEIKHNGGDGYNG